MKLLILTCLVPIAFAPAASAQTTRSETISIQQREIHIQESNLHKDLTVRTDPDRTAEWDLRVGVELIAREIAVNLQNVQVKGTFRGSLDRLYARPINTEPPIVRRNRK